MTPKVALAHDYLSQRGGAERVALSFTKAFPGSPLYTSVYSPDQTFDEFKEVDIRTSLIQHFRALRNDPRRAVPILPAVWSGSCVRDADVVLCSSSGWAHGVSVRPGCRRVVYCHNPARWLYQRSEYVKGALDRSLLKLIGPGLKSWDLRAATRADLYIANSTAVASRIKRFYGLDAEVVHPPVTIDVDGPREAVRGLKPGFWLAASRGRGYKNAAAVAEAVAMAKDRELVIIGSSAAAIGDAAELPGVHCLGIVSEATLRWLYANARALVSVSSEDFGLTPIEANSFGTPCAVLRSGGFLDSTDEGVSGVFIDDPRPSTIRAALDGFPDFDPSSVRDHATKFDEGVFQERIVELVQGAVS